jgi:hypothetical protein
MCNIPIYFCNNNIKHLQHTSYICNMCFQHNISLLLENRSLWARVHQCRARQWHRARHSGRNRHAGSTRCDGRGEGEAKVAATGASCHWKQAKPGRQPAARVGVGRAARWSVRGGRMSWCRRAAGGGGVGKAGGAMERPRRLDAGGVGRAGKMQRWSGRARRM